MDRDSRVLAEGALGYKPVVSLVDGLKKTIEFYRKKLER